MLWSFLGKSRLFHWFQTPVIYFDLNEFSQEIRKVFRWKLYQSLEGERERESRTDDWATATWGHLELQVQRFALLLTVNFIKPIIWRLSFLTQKKFFSAKTWVQLLLLCRATWFNLRIPLMALEILNKLGLTSPRLFTFPADNFSACKQHNPSPTPTSSSSSKSPVHPLSFPDFVSLLSSVDSYRSHNRSIPSAVPPQLPCRSSNSLHASVLLHSFSFLVADPKCQRFEGIAWTLPFSWDLFPSMFPAIMFSSPDDASDSISNLDFSCR